MDLRHVYWHMGSSNSMGEDDFSHCPCCGEQLIVLVIDHRHRRSCQACGYVHFRNPAPTVSLLIVEQDRILLGKRPQADGRDHWATPSGYIEFDEDFLTTARREAMEETGLEINIDAIINVTSSFFPPDRNFLNIYLLVHPNGGELQAGDDIEELRWFDIAHPLPEMAFQEDINMIQFYRQGGPAKILVKGM